MHADLEIEKITRELSEILHTDGTESALKKHNLKIGKTHMDHVERWAKFVKENPDKWKAPHTEFINDLYAKAEDVLKKIAEQSGGKEKIKRLREMKINRARHQQ